MKRISLSGAASLSWLIMLPEYFYGREPSSDWPPHRPSSAPIGRSKLVPETFRPRNPGVSYTVRFNVPGFPEYFTGRHCFTDTLVLISLYFIKPLLWTQIQEWLYWFIVSFANVKEKKNNLGIAPPPNKRKGHRAVGKALEGKLTIYYRYLFPRLDYMHINVAGRLRPPISTQLTNSYLQNRIISNEKRLLSMSLTILSVFIIILLMQFYIAAFMLRVSFQYQIFAFILVFCS